MDDQREKLAAIAPGRLCEVLSQGLRGHHPLFERDAILEAFAAPDEPVAREDAGAVGQALLIICRDPLDVGRRAVQTLPASARMALIRLYFRLLHRAQEEQPLRH